MQRPRDRTRRRTVLDRYESITQARFAPQTCIGGNGRRSSSRCCHERTTDVRVAAPGSHHPLGPRTPLTPANPFRVLRCARPDVDLLDQRLDTCGRLRNEISQVPRLDRVLKPASQLVPIRRSRASTARLARPEPIDKLRRAGAAAAIRAERAATLVTAAESPSSGPRDPGANVLLRFRDAAECARSA
jgi:hypothetical protein